MASFLRSSFLVLAAVLFSVELAAAPIVRPASTSDVFKKGGNTLDINRHWGEVIDVKPTPGSSAKLDVAVRLTESLGWARVGSIVKNALKLHPGKLAATAGVLWLVDQVPGTSIGSGGELLQQPTVTTSAFVWSATLLNAPSGWQSKRSSTPLGACQLLYSSGMTASRVSSSSYDCYRNGQFVGWADGSTLNCPHGINAQYLCNTSAPVAQPYSDADFDRLVSNVPSIPEDDWNNGLGDALDDIPGTFDEPDAVDFTGPPSIDLPSVTTTSTNPSTGDITVTESLPSIRLDYGTAPLSITPTPTTTTNTYTNGNLTNTSTTVTNNSNSSVVETAPEIPTDCDFMPTVCGFIDWVKEPFEPEEIDLAEYIEDEDFTKEVTFSGNATCPPPTTITTAFGDQVFDWTPGCDWAAMLKPLVVLGALLAALYISLGLGRSD